MGDRKIKKNRIGQKASVNIIIWFSVVVVWILLYAIDCYSDLQVTYTHGLGLLDGVLKGKIAGIYDWMISYYQTQSGNLSGSGLAAYPITIYVVFAAWNLPVYLIHFITGASIYHPLCLFWAKLMLVMFAAGTVWQIDRILCEKGYDGERRRISVIYFMSSCFIVLPIMCVTQYDIVSTFFMVWGLRYYLRGDKKSWRRFFVLYMVAISLKMFAFFVFVPMILLKKKKIIKATFYVGGGIFPTLLLNVLFHPHDEMYVKFREFSWEMTERLLRVDIPGGNGTYSVWLAIFILVCIYAFLSRSDGADEEFEKLLWCGAVVYLGLYAFIACHPQWVVVCIPFLSLLVTMHRDRIAMNLILDTVLTTALTAYYVAEFFWVYLNTDYMQGLLFGLCKIEPAERRDMADYLHEAYAPFLLKAAYTTFFAVAVAFLFINRPGKKERENGTGLACRQNVNAILGVRIGILAGYFILEMFVYFLKFA